MKLVSAKKIVPLSGLAAALMIAAYAVAAGPSWNSMPTTKTPNLERQVKPRVQPKIDLKLQKKMNLKVDKFAVKVDAMDEFKLNPEEYIAAKLKDAGLRYRKVIVDSDFGNNAHNGGNCYHIVYPPEEACCWICM